MKKQLVSWLVLWVCLTLKGSAAENENVTFAPSSTTVTTVRTSEEKDDFHHLEKNLKNFVNDILRMAMPHVVRGGSGMSISGKCMSGLIRLALDLRNLKDWAVKMVDAIGKPPSGILRGTALALGDYDECLNIVIDKQRSKKPKYFGQYCMIEIRPSKGILKELDHYHFGNRSISPLASTSTFLKFLRYANPNPKYIAYRFGICLPSACKQSDVQIMASKVFKAEEDRLKVSYCQVKQEGMSLEFHQIIIIGQIGFIVSLVLLGTLLFPILEHCCLKNRPKCRDFFKSLSLYYNSLSLVDVSDDDIPGSIRGIRLFSIIGSIYTHTYGVAHPVHMYKFRDPFNFIDYTKRLLFSSIANPSVGIDSFFFVGGFLSIYSYRMHNKSTCPFYIPKFITLQYFRITLSQLLVIGLFLLIPLFGSGPLWKDFAEPPLNNCKERWWTNVAYVQNFWHVYDNCLYHTWFLAAMMQLYLVTAVCSWMLIRWPPIGIFFTFVLIVAGGFATAVVTILKRFPASIVAFLYDYRTSSAMWTMLYSQLYNHIGPFCIGMLTAFLLKSFPKLKLHPVVVMVGWCVATATNLSVVYGLYGYRDGSPMHPVLIALYASTHRAAWAVGIGWIVFACQKGYGGIVNKLLSWKCLIPFDRMSHFIYLLHIPVMYFYGGILREPLYMGAYEQILMFIGYLGISTFLAYFCYVFFQCPYKFLEAAVCPPEKWHEEQETDTGQDPAKSFPMYNIEDAKMRPENPLPEVDKGFSA